jgi:hypothetical protein
MDVDFDLKCVIESNHISYEKAESIQINKLQAIKQELEDELHSKLALLVNK